MKKTFLLSLIPFLAVIHSCAHVAEEDLEYNAPGTGNPLVPGYFADPTLVRFGDTYYLFATTDGVRLASGDPQVWISKDFVHWYNQAIDIPYSILTNIWAPDMVQGPDGRYYYFHGNCEAGCNIYGYVSDTPVGPWTNIAGENKPVIPVALVGNLPSLDQHYFFDDDGSLYAYFGTWISSFNGMGWAKIDPTDMMTILDKGQVPMDQLPEIFEAPFMMKKNDKYIMMYSSGSCHDHTYRVQYAYADSPTGPFTFGENNPILETSEDGTVHGPGHHSVFTHEGTHYIVYHRHDNPFSTGGMFRQTAIDELVFENDSTIRKVVPTHRGVGYLEEPENPLPPNLAFGATASASSHYHLETFTQDYIYHPRYAVDHNNGTMWRSATNDMPHYLSLDLGRKINLRRVMTHFEFATFYYQYLIEYSADGESWHVYADRTANRQVGSPMIDDGDVEARFLRLTVTATEKPGMFAAIWEMKVYDELFEVPEIIPVVSDNEPAGESTKSLLVELKTADHELGALPGNIPNTGTLGGVFAASGHPRVEAIQEVKAIWFEEEAFLTLSERTPESLSWNSPFTVSAWVYNPSLEEAGCIVSWSKRRGNLMGEFAALMYGTHPSHGAAVHWTAWLDLPYREVPPAGQWHHIVLTFDGMVEKIYVNGRLDNMSQRNLFVHADSPIMVASSGAPNQYFTGAIASLRMYDKYFPEESIRGLMELDGLEMMKQE
jgi:xylan 1,4-beta-xylosidase